MGRAALLGLFLIFGTLLVACDPGIGITVDNDTNTPICWYSSGNYDDGKKRPDTTDPAEPCSLVEPGETRGPSVVLCHAGDTKWVVLTLGKGGPEIYAKSATCGDWEDSGATIIIAQVNGEFLVTDGLPGGHASP